ncbi:MAG: hypothetical protein HY661_15875 [Betaproteobacteria bacterium]|nr:hypothetical protein [Betaproteobacteria bacterium]
MHAIAAQAGAALALAVALLAGCYPSLDWREVTSKEGRFSVLLPGRPAQESRTLSAIPGSPLMHLWSAKAADMVFGVGYVDLQVRDAQTLAALRDALARNIQGKIVSERAVGASGIAGTEFVAEGSIGEAPAVLRARLLVSGDRVYQIAAVGSARAVAAEELATFFDSFSVSSR